MHKVECSEHPKIKKITAIEIKKDELEILLRKYIEKTYKEKDILNILSTKQRHGDVFRPIDFSIVIVIETKIDKEDVVNIEDNKSIKATQLDNEHPKIDDTVIIQPLTDNGQKIVNQYGCVYKIQSATKSTWILKPLKQSKQGKFKGSASDKDSTKFITSLEKDNNDPNRNFRVLRVIPFPNEFNHKDFEKDISNE
jgi:hypothetical protein